MTTIVNRLKAILSSMMVIAFLVCFSMTGCTSPEKAGENTESTEAVEAEATSEEANEHPSGGDEHPTAESDSTSAGEGEHPSGGDEHPTEDSEEEES